MTTQTSELGNEWQRLHGDAAAGKLPMWEQKGDNWTAWLCEDKDVPIVACMITYDHYPHRNRVTNMKEATEWVTNKIQELDTNKKDHK